MSERAWMEGLIVSEALAAFWRMHWAIEHGHPDLVLREARWLNQLMPLDPVWQRSIK